jgi:PIN domain
VGTARRSQQRQSGFASVLNRPHHTDNSFTTVRTQYVLIDLENIQPHSLELINGEPYRLLIFVGANQGKLSFEIVETIQRFGARAEYIKISGNGSNALDFHIAYYMGHLATKDSEAHFHVISKDTGFDPLIAHLRLQGFHASRSVLIADLMPLGSTPSGQKLMQIVQKLQGMKTNKPRTVSALSNTVASIFQKQLSGEEINHLLQNLEQRDYFSVRDENISYRVEKIASALSNQTIAPENNIIVPDAPKEGAD